MSINSILGAALSGLQASQTGMRSTSANISNVNTPGYAREEVQLTSQSLNGVSAGVRVAGVRRITDAFLLASALNASARASGAEVVHELLDRVQSVFGDPSSSASVFSEINQMFASFAELGADPSSPVRRAGSITDLKTTLIEF
ncbi:MAG: flagellar basal body protein, partial [Maricaulaceae bacterium]